ncbi:MAG TPA: TonB-dependent receptor, partial [Methylophilaceae bacterium]|nr:TonB-dependent receptor [Methylophilaceae bacterium]
QLSWNTDANLLIGGASYDRGNIDFKQTSQLFSAWDASRGVGGTVDDDVNEEVDMNGRTYTSSLFATDTYKLTSQWAVTASARYNYTNVSNHDNLIPQAGTGSLTGQQAFHRVNPALGATFTPNASLNFFGGYNEGSRAPSSIEIACSDPASPCLLPNSMAGDPPTLDQVVAKTWEGGVRGRLGSGVQWSLGAYRTNSYDDIQFIASNTTGAGYFDNVGKTRRVGLDMGLNGVLGKFRWNAGYSYVKATYESQFTMLAEANSQSGTDCQGAAVAGAICVNKGDKMAGIPEHQFKLRGEYSLLPNWVAGGNLVAFSDQYARGNENNADPNGKISGYAFLNLDTRYNFGSSGWQLFAKVNNVFDREYYTGGILGENAFTGAGNSFSANSGNWEDERFLAPGAPRAGWVGLRYEFGGAKGSGASLD